MTNDRKKTKVKKVVPKRGTTDQKFGHVFKSTFRGLVEDEEMKSCPKCGVDWENDSDAFGCWNCGFVEDEETKPKQKI